MDPLTLEVLAKEYQSGDRNSFRLLVESLTRTLIALAYRYTGDWESARDVTQETWMKVHRSIGRYDPDRPFRAWLLTIHRNTCISSLRSPAVQREVVVPPDELVTMEAASSGDDSHRRVERDEFMARLGKALEALSESQRTVFTKIYIENFSQREAAEMLGMSFGTLRTTLHFARKRLAGILREMEETS